MLPDQADGERLPLVVKDLGSCDLYPTSLAHSPNGRFVAVCGAPPPPLQPCDFARLYFRSIAASITCLSMIIFPVQPYDWLLMMTATDSHHAPFLKCRMSRCGPAFTGDGEYIIYTALAWRNKSYGSAASFVWGDDSSVFATREGGSTVRLFRNFKETAVLKPGFQVW